MSPLSYADFSSTASHTTQINMEITPTSTPAMTPHNSLCRSEPELCPETPFPFLKLPPELRNEVYRYLAVQPGPIRILVRDDLLRRDVKKNFGLPQNYQDQTQPVVTKVSRQVREEALPLYYAENIFDLTRRRYWLDWRRLGGSWGEDYGSAASCLIDSGRWIKASIAGLKDIQAIKIGCHFNLTIKLSKDHTDLEVVHTSSDVDQESLEAARQILLG